MTLDFGLFVKDMIKTLFIFDGREDVEKMTKNRFEYTSLNGHFEIA